MTEIDLKSLSHLKAPEPDDKARLAAVESAMLAFDEAAPEEISTPTQGSADGVRPISTKPTLWSKFMSTLSKPLSPATMALATGVCLLPIAGLVTWNVWDSDPLGPSPISETREADVHAQRPSKDEKVGTLGGADKLDDAPMVAEVEAKPAESPSAAKPAKQVQSAITNFSQGVDGSTAARQEGRLRAGVQPELLDRVAKTQPLLEQAKKRVAGQQGMAAIAPSAESIVAPQPVPQPADGENYTEFDDNNVKSVANEPVSTFSIDVDTAAYARVRRSLTNGSLPPKDMVRVEELVNYFTYDYPLPESRERPFEPTVTIMPTPWNEATQLMHVGIKGFDIPAETQPRANLVFLLDVSGSMNSPDKLPLLIRSFRLLLNKLNPDDTVSIVTYAGRSATVLEPTKASDKNKIVAALENLQAGGSTAGAQGIEQAYRLAQQNFVEGGVNRVMLATDGDFNVGISDPTKLKDFIARKRKSGIFLSVFGFGTGNYNDALMQSLAQNGNGTAAYIDTLLEARKALVEEAGGTLFPIATDVKIQMEFNPAKIAEYRLIGYETRALKREDFNNDRVDAGDIGSGHTVTAIYELTLVGSDAVLNTPLRYKKKPDDAAAVNVSDEIGFLKMRYKLPGESKSKLIETPVTDAQAIDGFEGASQETRFSVAVAGFGQKLRGNGALDGWSWEEIAKAAKDASGGDTFGYRNEFAQLVRLAGALAPDPKSASAPKQ